jgi:hypothetical protein
LQDVPPVERQRLAALAVDDLVQRRAGTTAEERSVRTPRKVAVWVCAEVARVPSSRKARARKDMLKRIWEAVA